MSTLLCQQALTLLGRRALYKGVKIAVVRTEDEGVGVDTPEDAERVAALLAAR